MKLGLLVRLESVWIGVHYSPNEKRTCINILPFTTVWATRQGGEIPKYKSLLIWHCDNNRLEARWSLGWLWLPIAGWILLRLFT